MISRQNPQEPKIMKLTVVDFVNGNNEETSNKTMTSRYTEYFSNNKSSSNPFQVVIWNPTQKKKVNHKRTSSQSSSQESYSPESKSTNTNSCETDSKPESAPKRVRRTSIFSIKELLNND